MNSTINQKNKRFIFIVAIFLISLFVVFTISEQILRYKRLYIKKSNSLEDGLILYDKLLGWRLADSWKGSHKHYDFDVNYSTNSYGFRADSEIQQKQTGMKYAFVGDSFTFSLGVNGDQTFVHILNLLDTNENLYLNFGVPGFSTDQEYLLIQNRVFSFSPDIIF